MRGIRQVRKLSAKLESETFLEFKITDDRKIGVPHPRLAKNIESRVSEALGGHQREGRGVVVVCARSHVAEELDVWQNLVRRLRVRAAVIQRRVRRAYGERSSDIHRLSAA